MTVESGKESDWEARCEKLLEDFNASQEALRFYATKHGELAKECADLVNENANLKEGHVVLRGMQSGKSAELRLEALRRENQQLKESGKRLLRRVDRARERIEAMGSNNAVRGAVRILSEEFPKRGDEHQRLAPPLASWEEIAWHRSDTITRLNIELENSNRIASSKVKALRKVAKWIGIAQEYFRSGHVASAENHVNLAAEELREAGVKVEIKEHGEQDG